MRLIYSKSTGKWPQPINYSDACLEALSLSNSVLVDLVRVAIILFFYARIVYKNIGSEGLIGQQGKNDIRL